MQIKDWFNTAIFLSILLNIIIIWLSMIKLKINLRKLVYIVEKVFRLMYLYVKPLILYHPITKLVVCYNTVQHTVNLKGNIFLSLLLYLYVFVNVPLSYFTPCGLRRETNFKCCHILPNYSQCIASLSWIFSPTAAAKLNFNEFASLTFKVIFLSLGKWILSKETFIKLVTYYK